MKIKPDCKKCDGNHWYFVKCDEAEAYELREKPEVAPVATLPVSIVRWSHADRRIGSRLISLDQTAPNVFFRKRDVDGDEAA